MRFLALVLMVCLAGCAKPTPKQVATPPAPKPEPTNAEKIIGVWEVAKSPEAPPGSTIEFTRDGKMVMTVTAGGQTVQVPTSYRVEGDTLTFGEKQGDQEVKDSTKIKKLTDRELVTDNGMGKIEEFKKK